MERELSKSFIKATDPLVSIMMPVYNGEKTIELAIKSLFIQTYTNWLCIIINDGSTDGTAEILKKYETDPRFKIIHLPENKGRGYARQVGLENAEGEYLAFLDADDFYHPKKLEKQVDYLLSKPWVTLVACGIGSFNSNNILVTVRGKGSGEIFTHKENNVITRFSPATSMLRTQETISASYRKGLKVAEDVDFFDRTLLGKNYSVLRDVLYYYFEFGSTSSKKIIRYYAQGIKSDLYLIQRRFFVGLKQLLKSITKFLLYLIFLPVFGSGFFLKKRGAAPSGLELKEFKKIIDLIT